LASPRANAVLLGAATVLALGFFSGCASTRARRHFAPANEDQAARAIASWREAVARAETLPPSRLLYAARIKQGIGTASGTLAISTAPPVRGTLAGPFGTPLAVYADGVLSGDKLAPVEIEPEPLLALLAGAWKEEGPEVRGVDGDEALLVWSRSSRAEGVLRIGEARFVSIHAERRGRAFQAEYSGALRPWPEQVTLTDVASGSTMRLTLQAQEPVR